jgi:UDP-glucuronate 4-epimerase
MNILITGSSGFIGFHLARRLLEEDCTIYGIDNMNDYYDTSLKHERLKILKEINKGKDNKFHFFSEDIANKNFIENFFTEMEIDCVINLAAQAGVRYSISNPRDYIDSNINGFFNILEGCRFANIKHLIFASSSSVYGMNSSSPFQVSDKTDSPISLYAATKKANESLAFSYSHLYEIPTTGLRFFTVYGPFGRPDMAYYKFTDSIYNDEEISIYNNGKMKRDFTYIDDIVESIFRLIPLPPKSIKQANSNAFAPYELLNIGNNNPISLTRFIEIIEKETGIKAKKKYLELQPGDVIETYADISQLTRKIKYRPTTNLEDGLSIFVDWFKEYYKVD